MQAWNSITRQTADFLVYFLVPALSVFLPAAWSRGLLVRLSAWEWLLATESDAAWTRASEFIGLDDESAWKMRWKQIELLDVRDLYLITFGRTRTVFSEIDREDPIENAKDRVVLGMHWGPSVSILKIMAHAGLNPAIPYRPPERETLRVRPFLYLFLSMARRYLVKTMNERAIIVGGAGKKLVELLDQPGCVVVIMDAPPMEGRPTLKSRVLNREAAFNEGFPSMLADKSKEYMLYAISLHSDGTLRKRLELKGPFRSDDKHELLKSYAGFLEQHLEKDSAQWRIWHAAGQFWV